MDGEGGGEVDFSKKGSGPHVDSALSLHPVFENHRLLQFNAGFTLLPTSK
jgi:hypothetical protein